MDLTELENIGDIAGKYRFIKFKYRGRIADEFRMRVVNSLALRKTPSTVIAMALNVSPSTVCILRKKLKTHICKQISRVSLNEYLGESLIAFDQLRAAALRDLDAVDKITDMAEFDKMKLRSRLRMEATSHDNAKWALMSSVIGDAKKYEPDHEGYKSLDDANEMKAILNAILSGDDDLIKELTTGKGGVGEVSDDFVIE